MSTGKETKAIAKRPATIADILLDQGRALKELRARWPKDFRENEAAALQFLAIALTYDLDPFMGEITPYEGRPYVEQEGWLKLIGKYANGQLTRLESRLGTEDEKRQLRLGENDWLGIATITRRWTNGEEVTVTRRGVVLNAEATGQKIAPDKRGYMPVEKEPWDMAEKRARVRALRMLFRDVLQMAQPRFFEGERESAIEGESQIVEGKAVLPEAIEEENLQKATNDARKGFYAKAREMGLFSQAKVHQRFALKCQGEHDIDETEDDRKACHALRAQINAMTLEGMSAAEAWEALTIAMASPQNIVPYAGAARQPQHERQQEEWT